MTVGQKIGAWIILSFLFYVGFYHLYKIKHPDKAEDNMSGSCILGILFALSIVLLTP